MKVLIEFEEGEKIDVSQIQEQLKYIKNKYSSSFYKFNIGGCFIKNLETVKNKTTCELSYDFIEPTFIYLNEIKEPEKPNKRLIYE